MDTKYLRKVISSTMNGLAILVLVFSATGSVYAQDHAPWFTVFPEQGVVEGWNWPLGAELLLTINGQVYSTTETSIITPWDPENDTTWVWIDFSEAYTVQPGDVVTISLFASGEMEQTHTVRNLSVTQVDQLEDTVKGIADPGAEVHVWPYATGQERLAVAKEKGNAAGKWNADLSGVFDLVPGECGRWVAKLKRGRFWPVPASQAFSARLSVTDPKRPLSTAQSTTYSASPLQEVERYRSQKKSSLNKAYEAII